MKYCPICERIYADEVGVCDVDGGILRDSAPKQDTFVGKTIKHRYRVIEKLGEGGMSVVYLAEQINIERKVALKVLHGEYARDETFVRRFRQEAKLAASLNHRNVIQIYDFDQGEDGNLFIAMEYLVGRNLKEVICAGTLEISQAVHLGIQIADGLGAAHRAGVIHRDIKPENIMVVGREDEVKLMDFGIARLREAGASTRLTRAGMIMGTPAYMAPEQIEGREINERTDIYAFGIVLYEMLSKRVPFTAPTPATILMKHLKETPVPLRKLRREIPAQLERIVTQALEKQPERRPANMEQIAASLHKAEREFAPGTLAKTLMVTQPFEVIEADATRQESGARSLLGKVRRALGAKEHGSAVESSEEPRSQQEVARDLESQEEGPAKTVLVTVALTQAVEAIPGKRMNRKWIALGGGAAWGWAHIGALSVFEQAGLPIDMISGCSMGGVIGAFRSAGYGVAELTEVADYWRTRTRRFIEWRFWRMCLLNEKTVRQTFRGYFGDRTVNQTEIPYWANAVDIQTGKEVAIRTGALVDCVRASIALPGLLPPASHNSHLLVDAGVMDPVPAVLVRSMGCHFAIAINAMAPPESRKVSTRYPMNAFDIMTRCMFLMGHEIGEARAQSAADVVFTPALGGISMLDFSRSLEIIQRGRKAAEDHLPAILEGYEALRYRVAKI